MGGVCLVAGMAALQANMMMSHSLVQRQLAAVRQQIREAQRRTAAISQQEARLSSYQYASRADTQAFIDRHKPRVRTLEEALQAVKAGGV